MHLSISHAIKSEKSFVLNTLKSELFYNLEWNMQINNAMIYFF